MASTFYGGIKLLKKDKKIKEQPIIDIEPKGEMIYPLNQHAGAAIMPLVKTGDKVKAGQRIADAEEYTAVPVHSSVSGTVSEVTQDYISVFADRETELTEPEPREDYTDLNSTQLLWLIRESGAVDYDRVPVHMKLAPEKNIRWMIINTCECEPNSASRHRLITEHTEEFLEGIKIIRFILGMKRVTIAAQTNRRDLITGLKMRLGIDSSVTVTELADKYPQNDDRLIVKAIAGREIHRSETPEDAGCIILGAESVYNIYRAVIKGEPITDTFVTISGVNKTGVYRVPIGTPICSLIEQAGGHQSKPELIINGDIMTGESISDIKTPVVKTTSCVISAEREEEPVQYECIGCGRCTDVCPMRLVPSEIYKAAKKNNRARISKLCAYVCTGCGACEYVCPSGIPLVQIIQNTANEGHGD